MVEIPDKQLGLFALPFMALPKSSCSLRGKLMDNLLVNWFSFGTLHWYSFYSEEQHAYSVFKFYNFALVYREIRK